jgi:hypothetical protein
MTTNTSRGADRNGTAYAAASRLPDTSGAVRRASISANTALATDLAAAYCPDALATTVVGAGADATVAHRSLLPSVCTQPLTLEEFPRRQGDPLNGQDFLSCVRQRGDGSTRLMCGESIGLGNKLLDFRRLHGCGLFRVLDIADPLVVVVGDSPEALAQAIDCICAFLKGTGFHVVFLSQIKMVFFALLEPGYEVVDRMSLIL